MIRNFTICALLALGVMTSAAPAAKAGFYKDILWDNTSKIWTDFKKSPLQVTKTLYDLKQNMDSCKKQMRQGKTCSPFAG